MTVYYGIDKTKIKDFEIDLIDIDKLKSNNVILKEDKIGISVVDINGNDRNISYLKITDGHIFNSLTIGVKMNRGIPNPYKFIEIHISETNDNNLKPLSICEYRNLLERLKLYLEDRYGIYVNFNNARFEDLEINVTAKMDRQFIEYEYLLDTMVYLVPKSYELRPYIGTDRTIKQYEFFNQSVKAKVYDKTRQLDEKFKISLENQYMRIEYKLCKPRKIRDSLNTEYINKINDEDIKIWLKKQIYKDLIKPIEKHIQESNKILIKMAKLEKEKDLKKWTRNFISEAIATKLDIRNGKLSLVIDIDQVIEAIKVVSSKSNCSRNIKRLQVDFDRYPYLRFNLSKLQEIKFKFMEF